MSKRSFAILLVLLVATRALVVLALADVFFFGEELGKGAAAKAILDGLDLDYYQLAYGYHEGGGFVVTHLKLLAFVLAGPNVLSHKLVALFTTSVLLAVGAWFVGEHFGRRAAWIFGILFVLCPSSFARFSLFALGTHFEALIFIVLILQFAFRIAFAPPEIGGTGAEHGGGRLRDWIGLGLAMGFGLYFSLQTVTATAIASACVIASLRRRVLGRPALGALGAFAVGALPLWWMLGHVGLDALRVRGQTLGSGTRIGAAMYDLAEPLLVHGSLRDWLALAPYPIVIGLGLAARPLDDAERIARTKALWLLAFVALFMVLFFASGLAVSFLGHWFFFLRLSGLWLMSIVLVSAFAARLLDRGLAQRVACAVSLALLVACGALDLFALIREGRPHEIADNWRLVTHTKGYDYSEYLDKLVYHFDASDERKIAILTRYRDDPELLLPSINHSLFEKSQLALADVIDTCRSAYGANWLVSLKGLGPYIRASNFYVFGDEITAIEKAPFELQPYLAEAAGRTGLGLRIDAERIEHEFHAEVPPTLRPFFLRGTGWRIHRIHRMDRDGALELITHASIEDRPAIRAGYEAAVQANTLP
jgi:hypothetical protein